MATYSNNSTIKMDAAVDATSFTTSSTQYAEVTVFITSASGTITHTGGVVTTVTGLAIGVYGPITIGPANTLACTNGRIAGTLFKNTP